MSRDSTAKGVVRIWWDIWRHTCFDECFARGEHKSSNNVLGPTTSKQIKIRLERTNAFLVPESKEGVVLDRQLNGRQVLADGIRLQVCFSD